MEGEPITHHPAVDGQCPRCGAYVSESSRFCRECLLQLVPGEDLGGGQTALLRRTWEQEHPEATQAFAAWAAAPEGPPPGISNPVVRHEPEPEQALGEWKPLDKRLLMVTIVLAAIAAFDAVNIVSNLMENDLLARIDRGDPFTESEVTSNDNRVAALSITQGVLYLIAIVVFIMWFFRAYQNVDALRTRVRRHGTGWAIGSWFVPILWFFRPKEIANDLWASGTPEGQDDSPPKWMLLWWLPFLIGNFVGRYAARLYDSDDTQKLIEANKWYVASDALDIVAAIFAIVVAQKVTKRLKARREESLNPPPPAESDLSPPSLVKAPPA